MSYPSPRRDAVLRALLASAATNAPVPAGPARRVGSLYDLAQRTGVAYSWVHKTVSELEDRGWVRTEGSVEVLDAAAVYAWWRERRTEPTRHGFHLVPPEAAPEVLFEDAGVRCAITTYFAENALQGHLFARRMDVYVEEADVGPAKAALLDAGAQLGGTNLRLWTGDDAVVDEAAPVGDDPEWRRLAPVPQVIVDLMTEGGSAREAADLLIQRAHPHADAHL